ncbi:Hsp20/alpha crystallin family protein [Aequorivita antarctica]|uniref:Hsp20/alpha crystallin family protein n=1 Tax=Aequorivita antarctica TaxID=153266 RepID=A0A5C6Z1T1_9FLAO|nr:Hsp20/alpha crystallin family protein [Aequorivita antarctica]TXD73453.1 Hsp20/alpha crystallin family protein [Aequorivita antarctica]SRX75761.1 Acid shock protein [Aequorivita antarctica]
MSLVKFNRKPWGNLVTSDFFDDDNFFDKRLWNKKQYEPALNIKETNDTFEVELAAPGFTKKDFDVTIDNGCLNISAESSKSKEDKDDNYTRKEFSYNSFNKKLQLPGSVKDEDIKAHYKDGVLSFNLIKKAEAKQKKPRKVAIS